MFSAIRLPGIQPTGFKVGGLCGMPLAMPVHLFTSSTLPTTPQGSSSRLASLQLWITSVPQPYCAHLKDSDIESFVGFPRSISPHLKFLFCSHSNLSYYDDEWTMWDKILWRMAVEITLMVVERLQLLAMRTDCRRFLRFLARHGSTMKSISLSCVSVTGCGPLLADGQLGQKFRDDLSDMAADMPFDTSYFDLMNADD